MSKFGSLYIEGDSFFHRMDPAVKALMFVLWCISVFMFLDIRVSLFLVIAGSSLLFVTRLPFRIIRNLFLIVIIFNIINAIFILIITPDFGVILAGHKKVIATFWGHEICLESLMYVLVLSLKYLSLLPGAIIFIFTTNPSRFAASLNRVGIPYKLAYTFNIMFRYLPEVQVEFTTITKAQAARGVTFGKEERSFFRRIKNLFSVIIPLMNSALERIDKITYAMELRSFGKYKKRSWYNLEKFSGIDALSLIVIIFIFALFILYKVKN